MPSETNYNSESFSNIYGHGLCSFTEALNKSLRETWRKTVTSAKEEVSITESAEQHPSWSTR